MRGISNYNKGENIATGFARPKVTSLFFDKIWLPDSLLNSTYEYTGIPKELLVKENTELSISRHINSGNLYRHAIMENRGITFDEILVSDYYKIAETHNKPFNSSNLPLESILSGCEIHTNKPINFDEFINSEFKYSKNRNNAILLNTENFCRKYNIKIFPVFHSLTDFEKESAQIDSEKLYGNNNIKFRVKRPNTYKNKDVVSICIEDFPDIVDDSLSWEQVLDIRKDKIRNEQLRKFLTWTERNFQNMSPEQIRETLESEMEEYKEALRFLGIKTTIGAFSTIVSSASSIVSILNNPEITLPLLSMASVSLNYASNTYMSYLENRKKPIAYLYNIESSSY